MEPCVGLMCFMYSLLKSLSLFFFLCPSSPSQKKGRKEEKKERKKERKRKKTKNKTVVENMVRKITGGRILEALVDCGGDFRFFLNEKGSHCRILEGEMTRLDLLI